MGLKQQLDQDLKKALLAGQKEKAGTLRIIKSVVLNEEIATGQRENGLSDDAILVCLKKEAKKRQEAADLYIKAGSQDRADRELAEKAIIEAYLPKAMPEEEAAALIDKELEKFNDISPSIMGQVIGAVKTASGGAADGAVIARLVREKLK